MPDQVALEELFLKWQYLHTSGTEIDLNLLCQATPHLRPALDSLIRDYFAEQATHSRMAEDSHTHSASRTNTYLSGEPTLLNEAAFPTLPGYVLHHELGRGGMGVVYFGHDTQLNRPVAIKMVLHGALAGTITLQRFHAEAEAMAALEHPHVVRVFARGDCRGLPYFVMEYCAGGSLSEKLRQGPIAPNTAAVIVEQLACGMAAAHARGILHRDLKPDNVLFAHDGTPKLSDFGLAKRLDESGEAISGLTQSGAIMGTPSYMAPEQARGESKHTGQTTDVYGLGALLYRMLTGRPPFLGSNNAETLRQVIEEEPASLVTLVPGVPRDLATICLKCLRKEPTHRYASAQALADDLQRFLIGKPILARPVTAVERAIKWVRRNPLLTGATLVVMASLIAGTIVSYAKYREAKAQEANAQAKEGFATQKTIEANERLLERDRALEKATYQLGISNFLLAVAAYENTDLPQAEARLELVPWAQRGWEWYYLKRQLTGSLRTFFGTSNEVRCVAYSPDGRYLVSGSSEPVAKIWHADTGALIGELRSHSGPILAVAYTPDGRAIVTGSRDGSAILWDAKTHQPRWQTTKQPFEVAAIAISTDGRHVATTSKEGVATIRDSRTGEPLIECRGPKIAIGSMAFHPQGHSLAVGYGDHSIIVWDALRGTPRHTLRRGTSMVQGLAYTPDGERLFAANATGLLSIWTANGQLLNALNAHASAIFGLACSPDGRWLATASGDLTVRLWDTATTSLVRTYKGHRGWVKGVAFSPDNTHIASASWDQTIKLWPTEHDAFPREIIAHPSRITSVTYAPDGQSIVTMSWDKKARLWNRSNGRMMREFTGSPFTVNQAAFNFEGTLLVTVGQDTKPRLWDLATGRRLRLYEGHTSPVQCVVMSQQQPWFITGGYDTTILRWNLHTGSILQTYRGHTHDVLSAALNHDESILATGSSDESIRLWDVASGTELKRFTGHRGRVESVAFSNDGRSLVSASTDRSILLWNVDTGNATELKGHTDTVTKAFFTPDQRRIVSSSMDKTIRVWDVRTGTPLLTIADQPASVVGLAMHPTNNELASVDWNERLRVWKNTDYPEYQTLRGHTHKINAVAFTPDGQHVLTGSTDRTAKLWNITDDRVVLEFPGHHLAVMAVAVSPDGESLATGDYQGVRVWNRTSGQLRWHGIAHKAAVSSLVFSPNGKTLASGGWDNLVALWDVPTGQLQHRCEGHTGIIDQLNFAPDGRSLHSLGRDFVYRTWDVQSGRAVQVPDVLPVTRPPERSPDGTRFAFRDENMVRIIPMARLNQFERQTPWLDPLHQLWLAKYQEAQGQQVRTMALFYLDRLLSVPRFRTTKHYAERANLSGDPRLLARALLHTPSLRGTIDEPSLQALAVNGDALAKRLIAQIRLKNGRANEAIPLLFECLLARSTDRPPVEEWLLVLAYRQVNQPDDARRWQQAAEEWHQRYECPVVAINMLTHSATNPWAAIGQRVLPSDLRYDTFHWEDWLESANLRQRVQTSNR